MNSSFPSNVRKSMPWPELSPLNASVSWTHGPLMLPEVEYATPCTYRCSPQLDQSIPSLPVCVLNSCGPSVTHPGIFRPNVASPMLFISLDHGASLARKIVVG